MKDMDSRIIGSETWCIDDVVSVAFLKTPIALSDDTAWRSRIEKGAALLQDMWQNDKPVYGVTTGYGASCNVSISKELLHDSPIQLTRFHGCGMGQTLSEPHTRMVMIVRILSLSQGWSGVRTEVLQKLVDLLNLGVIPVIPEEGSVGASGDLTPLSYIAAVLIGERRVAYEGTVQDTADVFKKLGITPLELLPKEGLALMNGTAVMTGLACAAVSRAEYLLRLASRITVMTVEAAHGNRNHYSPKLFSAKPHPGQQQVAGWIYDEVHERPVGDASYTLQDRYSLRCAPHVLGVLADSLVWIREHVEIEMNSANDNPLIDPETGDVLHGGHFYGGHIAFAMDAMKTAVANVADLLDRQVAVITDVHANNGLPANVSGAEGERKQVNHGFKAVQIAVSAWTAEALKLCVPASIFSRSTECHNQDKVSMGTISSRDALRVLELTEQVAAATLLIMQQGILIRLKRGEVLRENLHPDVAAFCDEVAEIFPFMDEDRPLEDTLRTVVDRIQNQAWTF